MADRAVIEGKLRNLESFLGSLRKAVAGQREAFLGDSIRTGAARYYLHAAIECCIDMGNHIIAADGLRQPRDYRDVFTTLMEQGLIPADFLPTLHQMVGMRNLLVHGYDVVDDERVYAAATTELGDFDRFVRCVMQVLGSKP